jgi:hypothetical protein
MGKMHSSRIAESRRLQRIIEVLKAAKYPYSAQEISRLCYVNSTNEDVMLNVATYIGEIRAQANQDAGYIASFSTRWMVVRPENGSGKRINKDKSITFCIHETTEPWHDGRPRYWLVAAPEWHPSWFVDQNGKVVPCTAAGMRKSVDEHMRESGETETDTFTYPRIDASTLSPIDSSSLFRTCKLARCGRPIGKDKPANSEFCCNSHKDEYWKVLRDAAKKLALTGQERLF